jgi:hypothetical protein
MKICFTLKLQKLQNRSVNPFRILRRNGKWKRSVLQTLQIRFRSVWHWLRLGNIGTVCTVFKYVSLQKRYPKLLIQLGTDFEVGQKHENRSVSLLEWIIWRWSPTGFFNNRYELKWVFMDPSYLIQLPKKPLDSKSMEKNTKNGTSKNESVSQLHRSAWLHSVSDGLEMPANCWFSLTLYTNLTCPKPGKQAAIDHDALTFQGQSNNEDIL